MRPIKVLLICCIAMMIIGTIQTNACQTKDPINDPTPCSQSFGVVGCAVCLISLYYIFFAKGNK